MYKKSQVTIFIITGIIILFGVVFFTFFEFRNNQIIPETFSLENEIIDYKELIQNYLQSCLDNVAKESLQRMAIQGGYVDYTQIIPQFRENTLTMGYTYIYLYKDQTPIISDRSWIESTIESYITNGMNGVSDSNLEIPLAPSNYEERGFFSCVDNNRDGNLFDSLVQLGWQPIWKNNMQEITADVSMSDYQTVFQVDLSNLEFKKEDTLIQPEKVRVSYSIPIKLIVEAAKNIILQAKTFDMMNLDRNNFDMNLISPPGSDINSRLDILQTPIQGMSKVTMWEIREKNPSQPTAYRFIFLTKLQN